MQRKPQIVDDQHAVIRLVEFECNGMQQAEVFGSPSKSASGYSNDSSESAQLSPRLLFSDFQFHVIDQSAAVRFFSAYRRRC
jgi:hypothetical protein